MTSLQVTEEVYNRVIESLISQLSSTSDIQIAADAIDYLKKNWKERLQQSEVYSQSKTNQHQDIGNQRSIHQMHQIPNLLKLNNMNMNESTALKHNMNVLDSQYFYDRNQATEQAKALENQKSKEIQPHKLSFQFNHDLQNKKPDELEYVRQDKVKMIDSVIEQKINKKQEPKSKIQFEFQTTFTKNSEDDLKTNEEVNNQKNEQNDKIYHSDSDEESEEDDEKLFQKSLNPKAQKKVKMDDFNLMKSQQQQIQDQPHKLTNQLKFNHEQQTKSEIQQITIEQEDQVTQKDPKSEESEGEQIGEQDDDLEDQRDFVTKNHIYGYYEKVSRVKDKWKVILKDMIVKYEDKEYIFHQLNGEWNFASKQ